MFDFPEALLLARIQFAFTVSFHFLFPAITIGLASYLAVLEGLWLMTLPPILGSHNRALKRPAVADRQAIYVRTASG